MALLWIRRVSWQWDGDFGFGIRHLVWCMKGYLRGDFWIWISALEVGGVCWLQDFV